MSMLRVEGLRKTFRAGGLFGGGRYVHAVADVDFTVEHGETLAIVGESGSGKSTTARLVMRLLNADAGSIRLMGEDITHLRGRELRRMRRHMQMVFQDPFASLNPRMRIADTVGEGLRVHFPELGRRKRRERAAAMLERCGMGAECLDRYPHQFSGGQRQRIGIARALAVSPELLVLDEPVSALDVSVQAQILNLLNHLQQEQRLAYLFISHDLSVVRHISNRVAVMFAGKIVEFGPVEEVFARPRHPYTKALLEARPAAHPKERSATEAVACEDTEGAAATGCAYRLRCPCAEPDCEGLDGRLGSEAHAFACLHPVKS